jgi:hypothetical protein
MAQLWDKVFKQMPGMHIGGLIQAWGEPEKLENNEYRWVSREEIQRGGHYEHAGYTTSRIYDARGYSVGTIKTPKERYVEPYTVTHWCEIRVITDKDGIISHVNREQSSIGICAANFSWANYPIPDQ